MSSATTTAPVMQAAKKPNSPRWLRRVPFYILVILFCITTAFPVYWMLVTTFQPLNLSMVFPPPLIPQSLTITPFQEIFQVENNLDRVDVWIENSVLLSAMSTVLCVALTVLGAYALSRDSLARASSFRIAAAHDANASRSVGCDPYLCDSFQIGIEE